jgi:cytochrome c-type biogenesis protein CcmF
VGELGRFVILVALAAAVYGAAAAVLGARRRDPRLVQSAENSGLVVFGLVSLAVLALEVALITSDFSIRYVAMTSTRATPVRYKIAALWGSLEGSILLWEWLQALMVALVVWRYRGQHRELMPYVLAVLQAISAFFLFVMAVPANPFERLSPPAPDGRGLNPLLEVTDMLIHPLLLYCGWVGFSVPYAFAMAALITGRLGEEWLQITRRWTVVAWLFLTSGIVYGGWWSYRTLGWGGYWAWDPVENASFMPWLTGTAFVHSVMIQERRKMLRVWNLVLVILTFSLVIFGTFLTRSGVIQSVHSFTQSAIGPTFLAFLGLVLIASLGLVAFRAEQLRGHGELDSLVSRESAFLLNNVLFIGFTFSVLLGTIFPLLAEAVTGVKASVGAPYFNRVNVPIALGLLFLMAIGPVMGWRRATLESLRRSLALPALVSLAGGLALAAAGVGDLWPLGGYTLALFVGATVAAEFYRGAKARHAVAGEPMILAMGNLFVRNRRRYGGLIVHVGVAIIAIGIASSQNYKVEKERTLRLGETLDIGRYTLRLEGLSAGEAATHTKVIASVTVTNNERPVGRLEPAQRFYPGQDSPFATVDGLYGLREDLYLILGAFEADGRSATLKAMINPLIGWIWLGGAVIAAGALLATFPHRRRPGGGGAGAGE